MRCFIENYPAEAMPELSAEIYSIRLDDNRYLIYAPLHGSALVTDAAEADLPMHNRKLKMQGCGLAAA
jgi:hypothetical protein